MAISLFLLGCLVALLSCKKIPCIVLNNTVRYTQYEHFLPMPFSFSLWCPLRAESFHVYEPQFSTFCFMSNHLFCVRTVAYSKLLFVLNIRSYIKNIKLF